MTSHHPWLKHSPEKIQAKLDAVSWDAAGLWHAVQVFLAASGGDGSIALSKLPLATSRRLTAARIRPLVIELVGEGLMVDNGPDSVTVAPWEQPPVEVWTDDVQRQRWARGRELSRSSDLRQRVRDRDRNLCRYCGARVNWSDKRSRLGATYDHVDPDGTNAYENVVVACRGCNGRKRDRTPAQAGMPLLKAGTVASLPAAQPAHGRSPEVAARDGESDRIQVGSGSESTHGPGPPCAPTRDRTEPSRIWIGSESGRAGEGPAAVARLHEEEAADG